MGSPPPPNGPPLSQQQSGAVDASFAAGPPVASLCGFKLPTFVFSLGFNIGAIPGFPPPLPKFDLSLGLNCSSDNPLDVSGGVAWGGGRQATFDPDPDLALDQQT